MVSERGCALIPVGYTADTDDVEKLGELAIPVSWVPAPVGAARQEDDDEMAKVASKMEELVGIFIATVDRCWVIE